MADAVLLKNVRPRGGEAVDVLIEGGRFQRFGKNLGTPDATIIDGQGLLTRPSGACPGARTPPVRGWSTGSRMNARSGAA